MPQLQSSKASTGAPSQIKQVITHDGKPFAEWSRTEVELLKTLDDKLFGSRNASNTPAPISSSDP